MMPDNNTGGNLFGKYAARCHKILHPVMGYTIRNRIAYYNWINTLLNIIPFNFDVLLVAMNLYQRIVVFETFTEKARRVIFFARYEASQFNSSSIQTEHIMLGLLREIDKTSYRLLDQIDVQIELLRKNLILSLTTRDITTTSEVPYCEIPINDDVKRIFQYAIYERKRFRHNEVDIEHLLLGMLREPNCPAVRFLEIAGVDTVRAIGVLLEAVKGKIAAKKERAKEHTLLAEFAKNLSESARCNKLDRLVGRTVELEQIIQIISRRRKNNPILLGEAGVGKTAIVE
jgi:ATP-dependent Clp protease ATP-binding subunit ClpC